jgi:hypothetical protein
MKRFSFLPALVFLLLSLPLYNNCGRLGLAGHSEMGTEIGNPWGTEIGNPDNPTNGQVLPGQSQLAPVARALCQSLSRCNTALVESACETQMNQAVNMDYALGLAQGSYLNFAYLEQAQLQGQVVVSPSALIVCTAALQNLNCSEIAAASPYAAAGAMSSVSLSTGTVWQTVPASACGSLLSR